MAVTALGGTTVTLAWLLPSIRDDILITPQSSTTAMNIDTPICRARRSAAGPMRLACAGLTDRCCTGAVASCAWAGAAAADAAATPRPGCCRTPVPAGGTRDVGRRYCGRFGHAATSI